MILGKFVFSVGFTVGLLVGMFVGLSVGLFDGFVVGFIVGITDGFKVGLIVGIFVILVGFSVYHTFHAIQLVFFFFQNQKLLKFLTFEHTCLSIWILRAKPHFKA